MNEELARLWPRAERVLDEVLDLSEPGRSRRAREACAGDPALERAVLDLLRADVESRGFLASPPTKIFEEDLPESDPEGPEDVRHIGPFRIVREIGRGGMGRVLLGERDDGAFEQRVAIKLLHREFASGESRETLVRERRILARLEHPEIARMYDGGVTAAGDPYFVMEYVDGVSIDQYCRERGLALEDRVRLFRRVCRAVEYAHGRFVVHCDLKPRNILVTDEGAVKLVDFGISRLLTEEVLGARARQRALTPAYAAPEQESGAPITAATDVFPLGLILYELLTGRRARDARVTIVCADLEAIVTKALRPDPAERYPTVEALRRDLEDYLASRPVSARASTPTYRLRKYVARHRWGVIAASAVVVSLLAGLAGVSAQSRVAAAERDRARLAERRASAVNEFVLHELLRAPMPETALGRELTVAEVLANASRSVGHAFEEEPVTEAEVRLALARTYAALGRPSDALLHAEAAHGLLTRVPGTPGAALQEAERTLAEVSFESGRYLEAERTLATLRDRQIASPGPYDPETLRTAAALGKVLVGLGEHARAEDVLRESLEVAEREHPALWRLAVDLERPLARALFQQQEGVEAERIVRGMLARIERHLGPDHPERVTALTLLANSLLAQLRYPEAVDVTEEAVVHSRRIFGAGHPATTEPLYAKALALKRLGRYDEALRNLDEALEIAASALGPAHPRTIFLRFGVAILTRNAGDLAAAEPMMREVVESRSRVLGEANAETIRALRSLRLLLLARGDHLGARDVATREIRAFEIGTAPSDADPQIVVEFARLFLDVVPEDLRDPSRALELAERAVLATDRRRYFALRTLGDALERNGRTDEAIAAMWEAMRLPDGVRSWSTEERIVELLRETGTPADIESFLEERIAFQRSLPRPHERMIAKSRRLLALHLHGQDRWRDAERSMREAVGILRRVVPRDNWELGRAMSELGGILTARRAFDEAEPLLVEGLRILEGDRQARRATEEARARLEAFYEARGRPR